MKGTSRGNIKVEGGRVRGRREEEEVVPLPSSVKTSPALQEVQSLTLPVPSEMR
jgi:hypothetical protein